MRELIGNEFKPRFKVKNIDATPQRLGGNIIEVGETIITDRPPKESYSFSVKPVEEKPNKTKLKEE